MPTYISLINWTEQGVKGAKDSPKRAEAARAAAVKLGGAMTQAYWTLGAYDLVAIAEFPDDETATAFLLTVAGQGNIRSTTMRAFGQEEIGRILAKLE